MRVSSNSIFLFNIYVSEVSIVFKIDNLLISLLLFILFFGWNTDYLQKMTKDSSMYGFRGGPGGVIKGKYVRLTDEIFYRYRNQVMFQLLHSFS